MKALQKFKCVTCSNWYVSHESTMVHIATKHEGYDYPKALEQWKTLAKAKPELWQRKDHHVLMQEQDDLLKDILDEKWMAMLIVKKKT